jgi:hypothetical protein
MVFGSAPGVNRECGANLFSAFARSAACAEKGNPDRRGRRFESREKSGNRTLLTAFRKCAQKAMRGLARAIARNRPGDGSAISLQIGVANSGNRNILCLLTIANQEST